MTNVEADGIVAMVAPELAPDPAGPGGKRLRRGRGRGGLRALARRQPLGTVCALVLLLIIVAAIAAPLIAPHDPNEQFRGQIYAEPSARFPLGADQFGRDVLSRIIYGARISLVVGFAATGLGIASGAVIGIVSGYFGGKTDLAVQRFIDTLQAFPSLILAMLLVVAVGPSIGSIIVAVGVNTLPLAARVARSVTLQVKTLEYVTSARATGASTPRIVMRHVAPQTLAPLIVIASASVGQAIIAEATLGFIGLGVPPPAASWGQMLSQAMNALYIAPWVSVFPGLALCLTIFALSLGGDALRDELDPSLRGR